MKNQIKPKRKHKFKFLSIVMLLVLCISLAFNNEQSVQVCHALASWTPSGGFQPGISATLPDYGNGLIDVPVVTVPHISVVSPNADGSLRAYNTLKVKNDKIDTSYGGWKHASFVEYFVVKRTDGRVIYDDDGILDVSWWKNGEFGYSDEIIDYQSEIWVETQLSPYNYDGFLGTVLNSKWKSGAYFDITWDRGEDPEDSIYSDVHDKNANTMGSGNYRNNGVNPGDEFYKLCDWDYCSSPYITIVLRGTAYWENGWWGGSYDFTDVYAFLSGFMPRADRSWNNVLTADAKQSGYDFYSPQPFVATASNLNNYIKINGTKMTPITDQNVIPFKEGFKIAITDEGKTKVSIENGGENIYTDYYCYVDTQLPDVNLKHLNSNAHDRLQEGSIITNADGSKSQKITGAVYKDQVQINFSASSNESPEYAKLTQNGKTESIRSGTWIVGDGNYTLEVYDLAGNTKTINFTIDSTTPSNNLNRIESQDYKVSKWYLASIPYGYTGYGTYSYLTYDEAFAKAFECEKANLVTNYHLDNVADFHYTNLIANGDSVKVGDYYYYKSADNPNLYVYYFDENLLDEAIKIYAKNYVSSPQYYNYKTDIFPNDYGNIISADIYHNLWNEDKVPAYIGNDFVFRQTDENESYKIYYDYIEDGQNGWTEFVYNIPFREQVNGHGLYLIREIDYVGHELNCYVFLDLQAPILEVTAKVYGQEDSFTHTISKNDIPVNGELVYYYEEFNINSIIENDTWYVMKIKKPDGTILNYTYLDELPNFSELGTGEYQITLYDRANNNFSFKVCLLGKAPRVKFQTINNNQQLQVSIIAGEEYNELTDIKMYRNDVLLNGELGYDEYPDDDSNEIINIGINKRQYVFNKGGLYKIEITDNFGRTTTHEFKFEKDLPVGVLKGVKHNGKTNKDVQFIYDNTKYTIVAFKNGNPITPSSTSEVNLTTLNFTARENINNEYKIILYDNTDFENLNIYKFTIRTIPPAFTLYGVNENATTSTDVYALWEVQSGYSATYKVNDGEPSQYLNGQILSAQGVYIITLTDDLGNQNSKVFEIDKTLDFVIYEDNSAKEIDEIRYTNKSIQIVNNEPLNIEITRDGQVFEYEFCNYFNDEGSYLVKVFDDYGNVKYFEFEIDKTPPVAELIGVENTKTTTGFVQVVWTEENVSAKIYRGDNYLGNYVSGSEVKLNGNYEIIVSDLAGNETIFNFRIDNKIEFEINTFMDGISNGGVRVIAKEELTIDMYRNNEKIEYNFEQILNDDGKYAFLLTDELGNQTAFYFQILNTPLNRIEKRLDSSVEIVEIKMNDEIQELDIQDNTLYLVDQAFYSVTVFDKTANRNYTFELEIDTTPPTIDLVGTTNGGQTKSEVSTRNASENPIYFVASNNEENFEYSLGEKMKNVGNYKLVVYDEAGNSTTYEFAIIYALNGASIALFGALLAVVVVLIIFLVKNKVGYYKNKAEITTIEETTEEIDNIEEK